MTDEDKAAYRQQVVELGDTIAELAASIHQLDIILAPVKTEEERAKDAIRRTLPFKLGEGARRKGAYDTLLEIAVEWGKTRNERRELATRQRAYERKIESLNKLLAKEDKRRVKV